MMNDYLKHYGLIGMRWGIRRYQNPDGSLTAAGRERYRKDKKSYETERARLEERANIATRQAVGAKRYSVKLDSKLKALQNKQGREKEYEKLSAKKKLAEEDWTFYKKQYEKEIKKLEPLVKEMKKKWPKEVQKIPYRNLEIGKKQVEKMLLLDDHDFDMTLGAMLGGFLTGFPELGLPVAMVNWGANTLAKRYEHKKYAESVGRKNHRYYNI